MTPDLESVVMSLPVQEGLLTVRRAFAEWGTTTTPCVVRSGKPLDRLFVVERHWSKSYPVVYPLAQFHAAAFINGRPEYVQRNGLANTRLK